MSDHEKENQDNLPESELDKVAGGAFEGYLPSITGADPMPQGTGPRPGMILPFVAPKIKQ